MTEPVTLDALWTQYDETTHPEARRLLRVAIVARVRIDQLKETTHELSTFHAERTK